ncbi:hypothetical protein [Burkholderia cenocepacia]|uniref:hypothetical protein n=1 Tax=Burkholderia cenocepacia TaxID=95486 RepID=UPI000D0C0E08|nr:hypothetical protein [Burkholderia cenocepacia]MDN7545061.1 hypothetical protein [Burkholderia cenocepacia]SOT39356.1 hypothetical protein F01_200223 [Burkholderia cenocepacia]
MAPDHDRDQLGSELTFQHGEGHAGNGMYCWVTEYPEESAILVNGSTAIPAEAERALTDERAVFERNVPLHELWADAAALCHRVQQGSLSPDDLAAHIRKKIDAVIGAARASSANKTARPTAYHFHRFVDGVGMAEDVLIERARTLEDSIKVAVKCCPKRPMTVLVHAPAWAGTLSGGVLANRPISANETGAEGKCCVFRAAEA